MKHFTEFNSPSGHTPKASPTEIHDEGKGDFTFIPKCPLYLLCHIKPTEKTAPCFLKSCSSSKTQNKRSLRKKGRGGGVLLN